MSHAHSDADVRRVMDALGCRMGTYADDPVCWTHNVMSWDESGLCPTARESLATAPSVEEPVGDE